MLSPDLGVRRWNAIQFLEPDLGWNLCRLVVVTLRIALVLQGSHVFIIKQEGEELLQRAVEGVHEEKPTECPVYLLTHHLVNRFCSCCCIWKTCKNTRIYFIIVTVLGTRGAHMGRTQGHW